MNLLHRVYALAALSLTLVLPNSAFAQQTAAPPPQGARGSITGTVKDRNTGTPLGQVSVQVVGTALGATTGADGRFVIGNLTTGIYALETKRVGYAAETKGNVRVTAGAAPTISDFLLSEQALLLNTVVSTGLNDPATGRSAPFSIAQISSDKLQVAPVGNPLEVLQGRVAGVQVRGGNTPGSDVVIQIRNPLSISGYTQPMIIVDGVIQMQDDPSLGAHSITGNPLDINPDNIESIEIVRGAAAAALYGQRAANGVINITTKRGSDINVGATRFNVSGEYGMSQLGKQLNRNMHHNWRVDENNQFIDLFDRPITTFTEGSFVMDANRFVDNEYGAPTFDNVAALFTTGNSFRGNVALSQSSLATNFSLTGGSSNESGVLKVAGGTSRQNVGMNLDYRAGQKLSAGAGLNYTKTHTDGVTTTSTMFYAAQDISRTVDITRIDPLTGDYYPFPDGTNVNRFNPLFFEPKRDTWDKRMGAQANGNATFRPSSILSINVTGGYQRSDREEQVKWVPRGTMYTDGSVSAGEYDITQAMDESFNGRMRAGILAGFGGWTLRAGLATGGQMQKRNAIDIVGDTLLHNSKDIDYTRRIASVDQNTRDQRSIDYSANVAFDYNQKYILDVVVRSDGNSLLPKNTRFQTNGRISGAWSMSDEAWWPLTSFTLFKPRYSIGTAGNNPPLSAQYELYSRPNGSDRVSKQNMGNTRIVPEKVTEQEFGLDLTFQNRYSLSLTYVRNTVQNSIRPDTILAYTGFETQQANLGDMRGDTYEATLEAQWVQKRDIRWSSSLVLDHGRQKITRYPRSCAAEDTQNTLNRLCEGYVFGDFYGYWHVRDEIDLHPIHHANNNLDYFMRNDEGYMVAVGRGGHWTDARWGQSVVVDGITYGWGLPLLANRYDDGGNRRTTSARKKIGRGLPDVNFGFGNQVQYKDWSLSAQTVGQIGGQIWNQARMSMINRNVHKDLDQFGKPEYLKKPDSYYLFPQQLPGNYGGLTLGREDHVMSNYIEDADFIKLTELRLAYRLNQGLPILRAIGMTSGSLALVARDLFTITNYSGYDPQVSGSASWTTARTDRNEMPPYRNFTFQARFVF